MSIEIEAPQKLKFMLHKDLVFVITLRANEQRISTRRVIEDALYKEFERELEILNLLKEQKP